MTSILVFLLQEGYSLRWYRVTMTVIQWKTPSSFMIKKSSYRSFSHILARAEKGSNMFTNLYAVIQ